MKVCENCVETLQGEKGIGSKRYDTPSIIIVVPGISQIESIYKQLLKKFKKFSGKSETDAKYDIRVTKLFGKHLNATDFKNILQQKHPNRKTKKVLNIYLGPSGRLNILANQKDFEIEDKSFRFLIIDCRSISSSQSTKFLRIFKPRTIC